MTEDVKHFRIVAGSCGLLCNAAVDQDGETWTRDDVTCLKCLALLSECLALLNVGEPNKAVRHPSHYGGDVPHEVIKCLSAWGLSFVRGNVVKYVSRAGKKDPSKELEDLEKARFYLEWEIERLKKLKEES